MTARRRVGWCLLGLASALVASPLAAVDAADYSGCAGTVAERILDAGPATYRSLLDTLLPGDLLRLAGGTYTEGLPLADVAGEPGRCIVIAGPATGPPAVFTARSCCNTVSLTDVSYLVIRHLELDGQGLFVDAVKAESPSASVHHLTLEDLRIHGHDVDQQAVGINSKCPAWNWVVRRNVVTGAGTGMYFGNSDGEDELVHSLIEHNLVRDTIGYNLQIKHQNGRPAGAPASGTTVVRYNVFAKAANASTGDAARPNVLIGSRPPSGAGADDDTLVYGNFFWQNASGVEPLFQGEGHVILYDNLFVNDSGPGVLFRDHNGAPRRLRVVQNTVVSAGTAIQISGADPAFDQLVVGNAVFGGLAGGTQVDNTVDAYAAAGAYLTNPDGVLDGDVDRLDLFPLANDGLMDPVDLSGFTGYPDGDRDFDGTPRPGTFRGAYAGQGTHRGWQLALERRPEPGIFADGFESGDLASWTAAVP